MQILRKNELSYYDNNRRGEEWIDNQEKLKYWKCDFTDDFFHNVKAIHLGGQLGDLSVIYRFRGRSTTLINEWYLKLVMKQKDKNDRECWDAIHNHAPLLQYWINEAHIKIVLSEKDFGFLYDYCEKNADIFDEYRNTWYFKQGEK